MRTFAAKLALVSTLLAGLAACDNSGAALGFADENTGTIGVAVYLDRDGSRTLTAADTVYSGARIALLLKGRSDTLRTEPTNTRGLIFFNSLPFGEYRVAVGLASLGDSLEVANIDVTDISISQNHDTVGVVIRVAYPELTVRQARAAAPGKRVFIRGVILAGVQTFRDTTSYMADSSGAIRLTEVALRGGLVGNAPGDSVSALGTISSRLGQPVLARALVGKFGSRPPPVALIVNTGTAASASTGALDAGLVQVIAALISDTASVSPDFTVTVNDGSGPLVITLDANVPFLRALFLPGKRVNARGVLVPNGIGGWTLKPRDLADISVF